LSSLIALRLFLLWLDISVKCAHFAV